MIKPVYVKENGTGISVSYNEFRDVLYIHISFCEWDHDRECWYRVKGLALTEEILDPIIEELLKISNELGRLNLPDYRQLSFDFTAETK